MEQRKKRRHILSLLRGLGISMVFMLIMVFGVLPGPYGTAFAATHSHANWTGISSLPTAAGSYYLTNDVTISSTWTVPSGTTNLCLNGHTIKKTGSAIAIRIQDGATLNLYDENNNGKITGGSSSTTGANHGGGVFVQKGTFNMYGGTITGNYTSDHGGGVAVGMNNDSDRSSAYFHMYGGVIDNNNSKWGGGLSIYGTAYIHEGTISNNKATDGGGGVELESGGKLYLEGGKVTGNQVTKQNGGLWKAGGIHVPSGSYCYIKGSPEVRNNYQGSSGSAQNNVFLRKGLTLTVNGNLTTSELIGISTEVAPTQSTPVTITKNLKTNNGSIATFSSDNTKYSVLWTSNNNEACLWFPSAVKNYQIQFFGDMAGAKVVKTQQVSEGAALNIIQKPSPNPSREGYYFAGWTTVKAQDADKGYNYKQAMSGDSACILVDWSQGTVTGDMSFYPLFVKDRLEIHLDLGAVDTTNGTAGYTFNPEDTHEWFDKKQVQYGQNEPKNTPAIMTENQKRQFTVNIDEKIRMLYVDDDGNIDPNNGMIKATRAGYELAGWKTQKGVLWNGEEWEQATTEDIWWPMTPEYTDNNERVEHSERPYYYYVVTLTAQWVPKKVSVEYNLGDHPGGSQEPPSVTTELGSTIKFPKKPESDSDYLFTGWKITDSDTLHPLSDTLHSPGESYTFDDWSLVDNGKITVTAQYREKNKCSITFDTDGGTAIEPITGKETDNINDHISSDGYAAIQNGTATSREGYDFVRWEDTNGPVVAWPEKMIEDKTYTAIWRVKQYKISFKMNGATDSISDIQQAYGTEITTPTDPQRTHYTFKGWSPAIPATMPSHDMTVEAMWEPVSYTVEFKTDANTTMSTVLGSYGSLVTLPDVPTRDNLAFTGWKYAGSDGVVMNPLYMPDDNPTIVAQWKPAPGTENETGENRNDGKITGVNDLMEYSNDGKNWIPVPENAKEITGLPAGDYQVKYKKQKDYQSAEIVFVSVGINYATITFDTDGGSEMEPLSAPVGAEIIRPADPTKSGYSFSGWEPGFPEKMPADDLILRAKWTKNVIPTPTPEPDPEPTPTPDPDKVTYDDLTDTEKTDADKLAEANGIDKDTAARMLRTGQSLGVSMDTMLLSTSAIEALPDDEDPAGTDFGKLRAKAVKRGQTTMQLQWTTLPDADGYLIYTNKCGKTKKYQLKKTVTNGKTNKWNRKKLKKQTYYKHIVVAYKIVGDQKLPIAASVTVHCTTKAKKNTIAKGVKVNKKKVSVAVGKTVKLKGKEIKAEKKKTIKVHRKVRYESMNPEIATVNKKTGLVTGVSAGTTTIYVYAQNGVYKKIPVTVQ